MRRAALALVLSLSAAGSAAANSVKVTVPVTTVTVHSGDVLSDEVVVEREMVLRAALPSGYATHRSAVVGRVARRVIAAGRPIALNAVREPYLFKEGERIAIVFGAGGLQIRSAAIALEPGIAGNIAGVRNIETGIIVRGVVGRDGHVHVGEGQ